MNNSWYPPPARPLAVEGGLKARSTRGAISQTWWSERFVSVLEHIGLGNRLERGRNYARKGQVISLDVDAALVSALVQGSRSRPYRVRIGIMAFGKAEWAKLEAELAGSAWYMAKLLAGEMPDDIEDIFAAAGLSLFPRAAEELSMDCSCPDYQVPCKHIAAAFYLLAEAFDEDPFTILAWRGRDREDLLAHLQAAYPGAQPAGGFGTVAGDREQVGQPLDACLETYFCLQANIPATSPPVTSSDALLSQLPAVNLTVRDRPLVELLRPAYQEFGAGAAR